MVEKLLRAKSLEMARSLIMSLRDRGELVTRADASKKLSEREWLAARGYLHVFDVLNSDIGKEAINSVFEEAGE